METPGSNHSWFQRETSIFYKTLRFVSGLIVLWFLVPLLGWIAPGIAVFLLYAIPCVLIFATGILTLWGILLISLGLREKESVLALTLATIAVSLPFLLFLVVLISV